MPGDMPAPFRERHQEKPADPQSMMEHDGRADCDRLSRGHGGRTELEAVAGLTLKAMILQRGWSWYWLPSWAREVDSVAPPEVTPGRECGSYEGKVRVAVPRAWNLGSDRDPMIGRTGGLLE